MYGREKSCPLLDRPRRIEVDSRLDVNVRVDAALSGLPAYEEQGRLADKRKERESETENFVGSTRKSRLKGSPIRAHNTKRRRSHDPTINIGDQKVARGGTNNAAPTTRHLEKHLTSANLSGTDEPNREVTRSDTNDTTS